MLCDVHKTETHTQGTREYTQTQRKLIIMENNNDWNEALNVCTYTRLAHYMNCGACDCDELDEHTNKRAYEHQSVNIGTVVQCLDSNSNYGLA